VTTSNTGPLIPRRRLGAAFRELRDAKGETLQQTAKALMFSPSKLSRIENGLAGEPHPRDVRDLIAHFSLDDAERATALEDLAAQGRVPGWWQVPPYAMPSRLDTFISYESSASRIDAYISLVVPGLLQTREYAAATLRRLVPLLSEREITDQVDLRERRRRELRERPEPPDLLFVIPETVLHRKVGTAQIMYDQLTAILDAIDDAGISFHVIPFEAGLYEAAESGMLTLFHFENEQDDDVVAIETRLSVFFVDQPTQVEENRRLFADAERYWLDRTDSRDFIERSRQHWKKESG
jgi:transcriptional regulator with XRE-family HTH domain